MLDTSITSSVVAVEPDKEASPAEEVLLGQQVENAPNSTKVATDYSALKYPEGPNYGGLGMAAVFSLLSSDEFIQAVAEDAAKTRQEEAERAAKAEEERREDEEEERAAALKEEELQRAKDQQRELAEEREANRQGAGPMAKQARDQEGQSSFTGAIEKELGKQTA